MNDDALQHGLAHHRAGRLAEAEAVYRSILASDPNHADALQLLGTIAHQVGQHGAAIELLSRSLTIQPKTKVPLNNLGEALRATGQIERSLAAFRAALAIDPAYVKAHSNLLLTVHFRPDIDGPTLRREHEQWAREHASKLPAPPAHPNDRSADRPLRIGYLSPDLRQHSVGYFIEPILEHHDHEQFRIYCYSNDPRVDEVTQRLQKHADEWRDVSKLGDDAAAALIRDDRIDILVDLTGHMAKNRLLVMARKPAPVQATYLGYPNGTGLPQIDFRITDALADPPGMTDEHYVERLIRLPDSAWCYRPPESSPPVTMRDANEPVTFGSFNKFPKISEPTVAMWAKILSQVPNSRLLIKAKSLNDPATRAIAERMLASHGIARERIDLIGWAPDVANHLDLYGKVDIALDTFPYHGTTTTCEAMWMGVPVVTQAGQTHVSRVGASLLSAVGLRELTATTPQGYVRAAVELARDHARRTELRRSLRERTTASPIMDARGFTRNLEAAHREMWRESLAKQPGGR
jgi:protein O-GlcNAc transferase